MHQFNQSKELPMSMFEILVICFETGEAARFVVGPTYLPAEAMMVACQKLTPYRVELSDWGYTPNPKKEIKGIPTSEFFKKLCSLEFYKEVTQKVIAQH